MTRPCMTIGCPSSQSLKVSANGEGHHQLDVAAGATKVGGGEAHGDVVAFQAEFNLDLDGVTEGGDRVQLEPPQRAGRCANR
jgi:hypothetical protein